MAFELKILTDLSTMPKVVETNIDEVTPLIDAAIERVKGLEVTDNKDEIVAADEDATKLTKMKEAIARFRIDHVAIWKQPMEAFETKCKTAEKRLEEAATSIKTKTGEVKNLWRSRKATACKGLWEKKLEEAFPEDEQVRTSRGAADFFIYWTNPKTKGTWVNSSVKLETTVAKAMDAEIARIKSCIEGVAANYADQPEEVKAKARLAMLVRFDMTDVVQAVNAWKAEQAAIAERAEAERRRKAESEARMEAAKAELAARREAEAKAEAERLEAERLEAEKNLPPPSTVAAEAKKPEEPKETYRLEITGTRANLLALRQWGEAHGITFKNIANK